MKNNSNLYEGMPIRQHVKNKTLVGRLYSRWMGQKRRCDYKKCDSYQWYGALGIRVEYTFSEFYNWAMAELIKGNFKIEDVHIGRIDHEQNYKLGNVEIQSAKDNVKDRNKRKGFHRVLKSVVIYDYESLEPLAIAKSFAEASRMTGAAISTISVIASRKNITRHSRERGIYQAKGYTFRNQCETVYK